MAMLKTMRDAASYGLAHLMAINEDVQTEETYSRKMRNDMNLAIQMLREAPAAYQLLATFVGSFETRRRPHPKTIRRARELLLRVHT